MMTAIRGTATRLQCSFCSKRRRLNVADDLLLQARASGNSEKLSVVAAATPAVEAETSRASTADGISCVSSVNVPQLPEDVQEVVSAAPPAVEAETSRASAADGISGVSSVSILQFPEDVHEAILLCLWGNEAAAAATAVAPLFRQLLSEEKLWRQFVRQEFPAPAVRNKLYSNLYRALHERQRCKTMKWKRVQCSHRMGSREGSPGMFARHGWVFVFGGWNHGPESDLHAGKLSMPLVLREVGIEGSAPPLSYEMKVTVLDDDSGILGSKKVRELEDELEDKLEDELEEETSETGGGEHLIRVLITGGFKYGGYHGESDRYGLLEIRVSSEHEPRAKWAHVGEMEELSNHTATFVPPRVSGPSFPEGYLLVFGGNSGRVTNAIKVLDIATFKWQTGCDLGERPSPRNSHSATLLQVPFLGDAILVVGGGTGDMNNGNPPRGGRDVTDSWWLSNLENAGPFKWTQAPRGDGRLIAAGRGHVACRLEGTGTVLTVGGGLPPSSRNVAFDLAKGGLTFGGECHIVEAATTAVPRPRAFGAGCSLPGGSVLIYGGWHPRGGTHSDFWIGHSDGEESELFKQVPETSVSTEHHPVEDQSSANALLLRHLLGVDRERLVFRPLQRDRQLDEDDDEDEDEDDVFRPLQRGRQLDDDEDEYEEDDDDEESADDSGLSSSEDREVPQDVWAAVERSWEAEGAGAERDSSNEDSSSQRLD